MPYEKKVLMIVCDGLSDRPVKELDGKTPTMVANTPNLDWFAKNGICDMCHNDAWPYTRTPEELTIP